MLSSLKKHYHWIIALVMLLQLAAVGGLGNNYNGLFILPITEELGISRASFSLAYTLKYLCNFVTTLLSGLLILRFGNKKPMIAGLLLCGTGYALLPLSTNIWPLAVGNVLLGIGDALCCTSAVSRIISAWFHKYQGLVWGAVSASTGVGGSILCMVLSGVIQHRGWRSAYFLSAAIIAVAFILVLLLVKARPEQMGLVPYGIGFASNKQAKVAEHWPGFDKTELWHQPVFYLGLAGFFVISVAIYLAYDSIVPHLRNQGLTQDEAVAQQSAMLIYLTISKLLAGILSDWLKPKRVALFCGVLAALSLFLLARVTPGNSATLAILVYAFALPMTTVLVPLVSYELLGYKARSTYHGIFMSMPMLGLLIASPAANAIFDKAGSYVPALLTATVLGAVGTALLLITGILSKRTKQ